MWVCGNTADNAYETSTVILEEEQNPSIQMISSESNVFVFARETENSVRCKTILFRIRYKFQLSTYGFVNWPLSLLALKHWRHGKLKD